MSEDAETIERLSTIVDALANAVEVVDAFSLADAKIFSETAAVVLEIDTSPFRAGERGLPVRRRERVTIEISPAFPYSPPRASVTHTRWAGFPHVLQGSVLCLYLDPGTQWHPAAGIDGFLAQLWDWFAEAIAGLFDPATSLYHPVGGVIHRTPGAPTLVVEQPLPYDGSNLHFRRIHLLQRTPHRIDLAAWYRDKNVKHTHTGLLIVLPDMLPFGAGRHLSLLTAIVGHQQSNGARKKLLKKLRLTADGLQADQPLHLVLAVPNAAINNDSRLHLLAAQIDHDSIDAALTAATQRGMSTSQPPDEPTIDWLYVDDLRDGISIRRDDDRPVHDYRGRTIELWGCGALGSVLAELLVRAGIAAITLRDPSFVTKGLLVRQNYTELDVGRPKVHALSDRLLALNDQLIVQPVVEQCQRTLFEPLTCDLIVDTTVNTSVATFIEAAQQSRELTVPVAQLATDNDEATLGILTICHPESGHTNNEIDDAMRAKAESTSELAPFMTFWDNDAAPPLTPTRGCSIPTFRGSSADTATIAGIGASLLGVALKRAVTGGYLFAAPHSAARVPSRTDIAI